MTAEICGRQRIAGAEGIEMWLYLLHCLWHLALNSFHGPSNQLFMKSVFKLQPLIAFIWKKS